MRLIGRGLRSVHALGLDRAVLLTIRYLSYRSGFHRRTRSFPSPLPDWIFRLTVGYTNMMIKLLRRRYPSKYTDADLYKTLWIDPKRIQRTTDGAARRRGWVESGDWDITGTRFMDQTLPKAIKQHYLDNRPWPDTVLADKSDNNDAVLEYGNQINRLKDSIQREGYQSQKQLLQNEPQTAWNGLNDSMHPVVNEIGVDIGREGEFLWNMGGKHRLAIAKVLDLDQVTVQVFRRHRDWQLIRERVQNGEKIPEELSDHPDLENLL